MHANGCNNCTFNDKWYIACSTVAEKDCWHLAALAVDNVSSVAALHTADNEFEARAIVLVCSRKYDYDVSLLGDRVHLRKSVIHFEGCRKNGGAPLYCELLQTMPKMCIHTLVAEDLIHALSAPNEETPNPKHQSRISK